MANMRTCIVCGNEYEYCTKCGKTKNLPSWHRLYCSEDCKDASYILDDYRANKISANSAKNKLNKFQMSFAGFYGDVYQDVLSNALTKHSKSEKRTKNQIVNDEN